MWYFYNVFRLVWDFVVFRSENADVIDYLEYYTTYPKTTNFCCVIIEGANKMAGKGQITSERASKW